MENPNPRILQSEVVNGVVTFWTVPLHIAAPPPPPQKNKNLLHVINQKIKMRPIFPSLERNLTYRYLFSLHKIHLSFIITVGIFKIPENLCFVVVV